MGHGFAIVLAHVGTLQSLRSFRRRLPWALGPRFAAIMNASSRLKSALSSAQEGRYEEALSEYVWFHEHALEEEPSLRGVRLSFALSYWRELAEVYPPALEMLKKTAEDKIRELGSGATDWELFNDVVALNEVLGVESRAKLSQASRPKLSH